MKKIKSAKTVLVILLMLIEHSVYSQSSEKILELPSNATNSLELNCKLEKGNMKTSNAYTVSLILQNTEIESVVIKAGKSFKFLLKENTWYAVKIKNEESIAKIVSINTWIPMGNRYSLCHYNLFFEIGAPISYTEAKNFDADLIDFPVAVILYDPQKETFNLDEKYFSNIREGLIGSMIEK
ncbi:MAG TPA: hypothetical protein VN026_08985 [Bacteroidia bacterium]|jgi:hypothetical protein|nr:hypothetical protein [Bacteroidia bacterium]